MAVRQRGRYELSDPELNAALEQLVESAQKLYGPAPAAAEFSRQLIVTALRLMEDHTAVSNVKLLNSALKELRHACRVFAPYDNVRKVAVFGSARTSEEHPEWKAAFRFAERMVEEGWMAITGAGDGIMGAAQGGAGRDRSFGVNIRLPFEQAANTTIAGDRKLINFRYFFTRKVVFVKESHAIALFPGGFGTHDEGFEALTLIQTGKSEIVPIVFVDAPGGSYWKEWEQYIRSHLLGSKLISAQDLNLFRTTDDVDVAIQEILDFYSNYHSSRYVDDHLVLRVRRAPDAEQLDRLNDEFSDIAGGGKIALRKPLPQERDEFPELQRITLRFNRRDVGKLRRLIDRLNALVPEHASPPLEASPHAIVESEIPPEAEAAEAAPEPPPARPAKVR
jgi:uncharacterized protein (TIGR00730 family)